MMRAIAANDLKTKGVAMIEQALSESPEAVISVRGQGRYVVMDLVEYNRLRACELEAALYETRQAIAAGEVIRESVESHMARLDQMVGQGD